MVLSPSSERALLAIRSAVTWAGEIERDLFVRFASYLVRQTATRAGRRRFTLAVMAIGVAVVGLLMVFTAQADGPAVCSQAGGAPGPVDQVVNKYDGNMASWPRQVIGAITGTFWVIFAGAFIFAYVDAVIGSAGNLHGIGWGILKTGLRFGLASAAFLQTPQWAPGIINGILSIADTVTGSGGGFHSGSWQSIEPGDVFMHGACIAAMINHAPDKWNITTDIFKAILGGIEDGVSVIGIIICYAIVMLSIVLVRLEIPIVLAIGSVLCLGFAAPDLFMGFPMRFIGTLVGLGAKIAALSLLVSVIDNSSASWTATIAQSGTEPTAILVIAGSVFCLAVATFFVPQIVGTLGGAPAMTFGNAIAAAMTLNSVVQAVASKIPMPGPGSHGGGGGAGGGAGGGGAKQGGSISNPGGGSRANASPLTKP